jgi:hypothetical protein
MGDYDIVKEKHLILNQLSEERNKYQILVDKAKEYIQKTCQYSGICKNFRNETFNFNENDQIDIFIKNYQQKLNKLETEIKEIEIYLIPINILNEFNKIKDSNVSRYKKTEYIEKQLNTNRKNINNINKDILIVKQKLYDIYVEVLKYHIDKTNNDYTSINISSSNLEVPEITKQQIKSDIDSEEEQQKINEENREKFFKRFEEIEDERKQIEAEREKIEKFYKQNKDTKNNPYGNNTNEFGNFVGYHRYGGVVRPVFKRGNKRFYDNGRKVRKGTRLMR